jgi:hypothetical protein
MDDWQRKLARDIVAETPAGKLADGEATLEVGFGDARASLTYVLELARAHRLPVTGSITGDHLWLRLGDARLGITLNRRAGSVELEISVPPRPAQATVVRWSDEARAARDEAGKAADLGALARGAVDAIVAAWRAGPAAGKRLSSAPPADLEDTPTRG